jgi:hypothetical protein
MITIPSRNTPTPITSGGPNPNHDVPVADASTSLRSTTERISSQISRAEPISGPTPMNSRFVALRSSWRR